MTFAAAPLPVRAMDNEVDSLVAEWNFDNDDNTIVDVDNKYQAQITGVVEKIDSFDGQGKALHFMGNGFIKTNAPDVSGDWTISLWVKRQNNTAYSTSILLGGNNTKNTIRLEQYNNSKQVGISIPGVADYKFGYTAPENEWHQLTFTGNSTAGVSLYVDGEYQSNISAYIDCPIAYLGSDYSRDASYAGNLRADVDNLKLFNKALDADTIKDIYYDYVETVSKDTLKAEIDASEGFSQNQYTERSWNRFITALENAKIVYENDQATKSKINSAYNELIDAREGLIETLAENQLHIASFNIAANRHPNIEAISQLMEKKNITIAGIQEVDVNTSRNNYDMVQSFIDQGYYSDSHFQKAMDFGGGQYGNAILSTYSLSNKGGAFLPWESGMEQRAYTRAEFEKDGKTVAFYTCHLNYENAKIRKAQIDKLFETLENDPCEYKIITGDFNTAESNSEFYPFLKNYNLANGKDDVWINTVSAGSAGVTRREIDNVITTRNIKINHVEAIDESLSDHYMLYVECEMLDESVVNTQLLGYTINDAKAALAAGNYTDASKNVLTAFVNEAEIKEFATQEEVNEYIDNIKTAIDNLKVKADYTSVNEAIEAANALTKEDYVDFSALEAAIAAIVFDLDESKQAEVDAMAKAIVDAMAALIKKPVETDVDKLALQIAVDLANDVTDLSKVVGAVVKEFKIALEEAEAVLVDNTAIQAEVDEAFNRLTEAMWMLEFKRADVEQLVRFINDEKIEELLTRENEYIASTWASFAEAYEAAKTLINDENEMDQDKVNVTFEKLVKAFINLRLIPNKDKLSELIAKAEGLDAKTYTLSSYAYVISTLKSARAVLVDDNATEEEITAAYIALNDAIKGLEVVNNAEEQAVSGNEKTVVKANNKTVKTADNSAIGLFGGMMIASLACVYLFKKREY